MIETLVEGETGEVAAAATWLRGTLELSLEQAGDQQSGARSTARGGWEGLAADGYQDFTRPIVAATDKHATRVGRAATALDEYATRLRTMKQTMADLRTRAVAGGLSVSGTVIAPPPTVPASVVVPGSPEDLARQEAIDKVILYNTLADEAITAQQSFDDWIRTNLAADVADARETDDIDVVLSELESLLPNFAAGVGSGLTGGALIRKADDYRDQARELRRRSRVSGDPRVRGHADTPSGRGAIDDLLGKSRGLGRFGRILSGPVGIGIDIVFGIQEGHESGDWTRAALTTGTSIAVGVGVTALVAAGIVTAPAWAVVVGGGALAAGAAWGVGQVYDHWDDITGWSGDRVDDVKDFASDTWDDATDFAGDAWDAATFW